jgi:peptidoglycan/xylan/chitin deacetylase (PgdA/CDA1 family)
MIMPTPAYMPAYKFPKRAYGFYLAATLLVAACLEGIIFLLLLGNTLGPFSLRHQDKPLDPSMTRETRVAILVSRSSAGLYSENPEGFAMIERQWERVLGREGISFRAISDLALRAGLGDANVLILPASACLDQAQRKTIDGFLAEGKGVVASGPVGSRDGGCAWKGWNFLTSLTGAQAVSQLTPPGSVDVGFRGQLFFSQGVPAGLKLEVPSQELTLLDAREPDAFLCDWMLRPVQGKSMSAATLALHQHVGTGRVVWFGFNSNLPVQRVTDQALVDHYLVSAVWWAAKQPVAIVGDWPNQNASAALVAVDNEEDFANSHEILSLLKAERLPAIFFCDSTTAQKSPQVVRDFETIGEVASLGDTEEPMAGQLPRVQAARLHQSKMDLEEISRGKVVGYASPQGISDPATILALNDTGYRYNLNETSVTRAVPEIVDFTSSVLFPLQKAEVFKIYRISPDDFEVLANYHGPDPPGQGLADAFLADFRRIDYLGGVYTFYIHNYLLGRPEYRGILKTVLDTIRARPVWITTGRELVKWWSAREKLEVQSSKLSIHRVRVDVANKGQSDVENASVYIYLPYHPRRIQISAVVFRLRPPKFQMLNRDDILRIDFPRLSAQTNYTYVVGLDE